MSRKIDMRTGDTDEWYCEWFNCPACGLRGHIHRASSYCSHCGTELEWPEGEYRAPGVDEFVQNYAPYCAYCNTNNNVGKDDAGTWYCHSCDNDLHFFRKELIEQ